MKDESRTKEQLINELKELRRKIARLETSEAELKQAAKTSLLDDKSHTEAILAAIGDGISIQAVNYRILYQNQTHKDLFGDHVGEFCYTAYRERKDVCEECPIAMCFKDGRIHKVERNLISDTGILHIAVTASPLRNSKGEIIAGIEVTRDITKRKMAEKELDLERQQLLSIFESINEVVYVSDPHTHEVLYTNKASKDLFGNVVGQKCYKAFQNLESPCPFCTNKHIFGRSEGQPYIWEFQNRINHHWFRCIDKAIHWPDGRMVRYEMAIDITDRKLSEGALVESEKRYRTLAEAAHDMIFIIDSEDKVQYANSFAAQSLGYSPEDIIGTPRETLFPADTTSRQRSFLQKVFKNGAPLYSESETQFKNHKLWIGTMLVPIKDEGGEVNSVLGISRDITETKKAEEAIKKSEEKYRMLIENIQDGVFIIQDAKIKFLNEAFAKIIGYTAEELVGIDIQKLIAPEDLDIVMDRYQQRLAGRDVPKEYEFLMLHKDGVTRVIVNMLVGLVDYQGRTASMGTVKDVTEHKKMEAELQKAQKLESLGILAGGIAHDFNNILTAITGNISLAKMYAQPGLEVFDILTEAEKASLRAKNLTTQLLTFSKGGIPVKRLSSIPKLIKDSCSFALSGSKIKCEISSPDNLWPVEIDEGQISQVIHHMIINAQQAMPEGGIIRVKAENITADAEHPLPLKGGKYLKISIKDHGIGISEEHLAKIFDPYFTTKQEGSGLGLASAYSIIKKHDGHITAESKLGEGTTFYIYLPASEKKIPIVKDTGISSASRGKGKVLVMDDDDTVRLVVGRMLGQCGYEAEFAEDGDKAIDLYKKAKATGQPFDAVIMDLIIPAGMGGKEAIKRLIEIDPDIRAIVSSGYSDDPVLSNFKEYGFKDAMAKPYEIAELRQMLHKVISGI